MAKKNKKRTGSEPQKVEVTKRQSKKFVTARHLLPGDYKINALVFLSCIIATVLLYAGDLHLGFFRIDDLQYVEKNPWIRNVSGENINYILGHPYFANYSPVHLLSYMIDYAIGGKDAFIFHLSSNIWAGFVAGFVYLTALAITQKRFVAIAAAVLFIIHPVHVEAIAWISSRKDLVAAAFILPSFLAYLKYRQNTTTSKRWYVLSLFLFLLAAAGKLSVVVFPAVIVLYDLFVEKRNLLRSLLDKIPYLAIAVILAFAVANAQPKTGGHTDAVILSKSLVQSLWLLTGFGEYVMYRVPPSTANALFKILGALFLLVIFVLPLLLRRRYPKWMVLIYWVLVTYLPTQVLSFTYPVTDRYLFLPSVAVCILISWGIFSLVDRLKKWRLAAAAIPIFIITFFWTKNTINYLSEWKDPRSVWYEAKKKSSDAQVYYNLGWQYSNKSASFGSKRRKDPLSVDDAKKYAAVVWKENSQLPDLLNELNTSKHNGPVEDSFKTYLQATAKSYLDVAVAKKESRIMADLFLHRGVLFLDMGKIDSAKNEFLKALDESSKLGYAEGQQEILVNCHYNLGVAEWTLGNYQKALEWIKMAEEEQNRFGGDWVAGLSGHRKRLEQIITTIQNNK